MPLLEDLPYPTSTDTPDVPRDILALVTALAARTAYRSYAAKSPAVPAGGSLAVVFPVGLFSQPPIVVVAPLAAAMPSAIVQAYPVSITAAGFTIMLHTSAALAGSAWSAGVEYVAIQVDP